MKILLLCHEYPPLGGGGGVGAKQYAEAWARKGHTVTVLTSWAPALPAHARIHNVDVIRLSTVGLQGRATVPFLALLSYCVVGFCYLLRHFRSLRSHQVINSHFSVPTGVLGVLAAKLLGLPHVLTIIGGDVYDPTKRSSPHRHFFMRAINRLVINTADRLVAISSDTKHNAQKYYGITKAIQVVNYGFDPTDLPPGNCASPPRADGVYRLIAVGRLISRKGFAYLIQAMALLPTAIHLRIIGDGPLEAELKELDIACNVADRVTFAGYQARQQIYQDLQQADCFVLSSVHEGLGIVVQEAMYAGLPIVATNNGGQIDLLQEPRNGLLVPPGDSHRLAAAITQFYTNRQLGLTVGHHNRHDIEKYFMGTNADEYIHLFSELLCQNSAVESQQQRAPIVTEKVR
jgi:glycosyltransferase involved in cell wall biosynthesis